mmetsp:Transcript_16779/g.32814  ORF Transcript_16779/g.32814 Transcript_16779/m.32814 type:complete len:239 (-) Transcript_16779:25-741(-)
MLQSRWRILGRSCLCELMIVTDQAAQTCVQERRSLPRLMSLRRASSLASCLTMLARRSSMPKSVSWRLPKPPRRVGRRHRRGARCLLRHQPMRAWTPAMRAARWRRRSLMITICSSGCRHRLRPPRRMGASFPLTWDSRLQRRPRTTDLDLLPMARRRCRHNHTRRLRATRTPPTTSSRRRQPPCPHRCRPRTWHTTRPRTCRSRYPRTCRGTYPATRSLILSTCSRSTRRGSSPAPS